MSFNFDLWNHNQQAWERHVCPSPQRLQQFWDSIIESPQLQGHPIRSLHNWRQRAIPFSLHGDGVPVVGCMRTWAKSMYMYSISSMVGNGNTIQTMLLIWASFKDALNNGGLQDLWEQTRLPFIHPHHIRYIHKVIFWFIIAYSKKKQRISESLRNSNYSPENIQVKFVYIHKVNS